MQGVPRPPIVTILGHVDHGKTTLLDFIRKTKVAQKEAGAITQGIGASLIEISGGKKITFIDTPGHAAFANMRARGAKVADIAILAVAADDGVKPQTKEAFKIIKEAKIPFIVAATKMDLPHASIEDVKRELQKEGILFEGSGGDTPIIGVSGKTGKGVDELLDLISLVAELNEIRADPKADLEAVVIEASKEKQGPTATIVVRNGKISVGDLLVTETVEAKVRGLFDSLYKKIESAEPGEPALVLGFDDLPMVGSRVWKKADQKPTLLQISKKEITPSLVEEGRLPVIIKAKNKGGLEALTTNLPTELSIVSTGLGDVTESDIFLAKSTKARIFAFETKLSGRVAKLAEEEGISVDTYEVIYHLFERVQTLIKKSEPETLGRAEVVAQFPFKNMRVAGCKVTQGGFAKGDEVTLRSGDKDIGVVKVLSMKKGKQEVGVVKQGEECGILFVPQLDFKVGDVILSVLKNSA